MDVGVRRKQRDDYVRDRKRRGRNKDKGKKKRRKDNQRMRHAKMTEKGAKVFFLLKLYIYPMRVIYTTNVARSKLCFHPTNMSIYELFIGQSLQSDEPIFGKPITSKPQSKCANDKECPRLESGHQICLLL